MNTLETNVIIAAVIGFVLGIVLMAIISRSSKGKQDEETAKLRAEYHRYREQVNAHFAKTADAVDGLTKSYQEVFDHLSHGAQNLMDKKALQAQLEKRQGKAVTLAYLVDQGDDMPRPKVSKVQASSVVGDGKKPQTPTAKNSAQNSAHPSPVNKPAPAAHPKPKATAGQANEASDAQPAAAKPAAAKSTASTAAPQAKPTAADAKPSAAVKDPSPAQAKAAQNTAESDMPKPKSNVHRAAENAGLKPAKDRAAADKANKPASGIDEVKKHIKDDKGTKS